MNHYEHCVNKSDTRRPCQCNGAEQRAILITHKNIKTYKDGIAAVEADGFQYVGAEENNAECWSLLKFKKKA